MSSVTIRVHFDGKVLIPTEPVDLPKDGLLEVDVRRILEPAPGSPKALLQYLRDLPPIPQDWIDELEQAIEQGKTPTQYRGVFDDDTKAE